MQYYTSLKNLEKRFDTQGQKSRFKGSSILDYEMWKRESREKLLRILGIDQLKSCALMPKVLECVEIEEDLVREKILIQVEEEVWMPVYALIPQGRGKLPCILLPMDI